MQFYTQMCRLLSAEVLKQGFLINRIPIIPTKDIQCIYSYVQGEAQTRFRVVCM